MRYKSVLMIACMLCFVPGSYGTASEDTASRVVESIQPEASTVVSTDEDPMTMSEPEATSYRLGDFELTVTKDPAGFRLDELNLPLYHVSLLQSGRTLFKDDSFFMKPEESSLEDVPSPGCKSVIAYAFSGGAHCCFTGILCTLCGNKSTWSILDLRDHGEAEPVDTGEAGGNVLQLLDFRFAYYDTGQSGPAFSFATSPTMYRLLVFGQKGWEVDSPGAYGSFYEKLMKQKESEAGAAQGDEELAALAIEATYYSIMAGNGDESSEALFRSLLPDSWRLFQKVIYEDIKEAAWGFYPLVDVASSEAPRGDE